MKKYILIIALIALIAFITMPVSAYFEFQYSDSYIKECGDWGNSHWTTNIIFHNASADLGNVRPICQVHDTNFKTLMGWHAAGALGANWVYQCDNAAYDATCHMVGTDRSSYAYNGAWYDEGFGALDISQGTITHAWVIGVRRDGDPGDETHQAVMWVLSHEYYSPVQIPVADFENVAHPKSCYYPDEQVDFADLSTNIPTSWEWVATNNDEYVQVLTDQNPVFTMGHTPGYVDIQLCAENSAGEDCESKSGYLKIGNSGECTYNETVNITPVEEIDLIPTGIPNFINMTAWRSGCEGSALGNATVPYCNAVDDLSNVTNSTFSGIIGIFITPLDWITVALEDTHDNIDTILAPLTEQSTIFLGIITRAMAALPAVFINIVTLGLLIDVVRIVLRGKGGE
jgi:hypothetical protein